MATASTSANDLTRQQLDELDSLLQRMLSLPINPADPTPPPIPAATLTAFAPPLPPANFGTPTSYTAPPPAREAAPAAPPPARRPDPPAAPPPPAPRLFAAPVEEPPRPEPAPVTRTAPTTPKPERKPKPEPKVEQPVAPRPQPQPVVVAPVPVPGEAAVPVASELPFAQPELIAPPSEPVPILFAPLVLFNRLLNGALGMLGLPGRVLRSGLVKNLFGLAGFGLILYTGAKVAQVHGWISLPVQLPWPR